MLCNLLLISSHLAKKKYLKLVWNGCDEFEQVNVGCLLSYVFSCMGGAVWNQKHVYWICE